MNAEQAAGAVGEKFKIIGRKEFRGEITLVIERSAIVEAARFCKEELQFDMLLDITSIDNFGEEPR
jgi:NADH-quinone oxidoreductase subunit C